MFLDYTQRRSTIDRTPLEEWSAHRRDLYLTTHDTHNRQISMPLVGFEPTISAGERPQRPLPDNTRHSQQTNIHAPSGNRIQDLSKRAAAGRCAKFGLDRFRNVNLYKVHTYLHTYKLTNKQTFIFIYIYIYIHTHTHKDMSSDSLCVRPPSRTDPTYLVHGAESFLRS